LTISEVKAAALNTWGEKIPHTLYLYP